MVIKQVELQHVCGITSKLPDTGQVEVAFAGKSNVGKSSLINALMNRKSLARTSAQPGKTQTINYYLLSCAFRILFSIGADSFGYYSKTSIFQFQDLDLVLPEPAPP